MAVPAPSPLLAYLTAALDERLTREPDDRARIVFLARQWGSWQAKYGRFIAHSVLKGPLPAEFSFGPHGDITATDFVLVLALIDDRKRRFEGVMA